MTNVCLWINGVKISDVQGITDNFNITDVRGYFLGGSLIPWLESRGEYDKAYALKNIPAGENPDKALYAVFSSDYTRPDYHKGARTPVLPLSGQNSYRFSSLSGGFNLGSRKSGSYSAGSFRRGSYHEYEYEYEFGSFFSGSFSFGSFTRLSGSFMSGSFRYDDFLIHGKFNPAAPVIKNLSSEPLNRFGYGIHII